jgi:hypothetical protein
MIRAPRPDRETRPRWRPWGALLLLALLADPAGAATGPTLLGTGDWLGRLDPVQDTGGAVRLAAFQDRFEPEQRILLCVGNVLGPDPVMTTSGGPVVVEALDRLGAVAWLPADHDFARGLGHLLGLTRTARVRLVTTNLVWQDSGDPVGAPYLLFERGGRRIAVLGLLGPDQINHLDVADQRRLVIDPPLVSARTWARRIREQHAPDVVVALARLDLEQETMLLEAGSGVDLIFGGLVGRDPTTSPQRDLSSGDGKHALHGGAFGQTLCKAELQTDPEGRVQINTRITRLHGPWQPSPAVQAFQGWWEAARASLLAAWERAHEGLAALDPRLEAGEARSLIAEVCREQAHGELALFPGGLFESPALLGAIRHPRALLALVRWEDALVTVDIPGSRLAGLMGRVRDPVTAGWRRGPSGWLVNGHPLDERSTYRVVVTRPMAYPPPGGPEGLESFHPRILPFTVRRAVERELRALGATGRMLGADHRSGLEDDLFWKSSFQFMTDAQQRNVDTRNGRYPELPWQSDRSGLNWGGEATWQLGTAWGPHDFAQTLQLAYRADQLAGGASQTSTDLIQALGTYRGTLGGSDLFRPFGSYQVSTRFSPDASGKGFLLGQFGGGISHTLLPGIDLREGLEFRRQFLDPAVPDRLGGTLLLAMKGAWQGIQLSSQSRVFATGDWQKEGILLDEEAQVQVPLGSVTALTLRFNAYKNTREAEWALRQLLGLSFRFDRLEALGT